MTESRSRSSEVDVFCEEADDRLDKDLLGVRLLAFRDIVGFGGEAAGVAVSDVEVVRDGRCCSDGDANFFVKLFRHDWSSSSALGRYSKPPRCSISFLIANSQV